MDKNVNKTIYGIFSGAYSDWQVHGYMENRKEAEKYCALKNSQDNDEWNQYYVIDINNIHSDVSMVKINCYHEVVFDFNKGMRNEPDRYDYYIGKNRPPNSICNINFGWISFSFNCENRKKAEKIAQDKYYQFLSYQSQYGTDNALKLLNIEKW